MYEDEKKYHDTVDESSLKQQFCKFNAIKQTQLQIFHTKDLIPCAC